MTAQHARVPRGQHGSACKSLTLLPFFPLYLLLTGLTGGTLLDEPAAATPVQTTFAGAPAANLGYRGVIDTTPRRTGGGEHAGSMQCLAGDLVSFHIGDIELGSALCAQGAIYPVDVSCGLADPLRAQDCAVNIAMFLQAHAPDGAGIIVISEQAHADAAGVHVDFTLPQGAFEGQFHGDGPPGQYMSQRNQETGRPDETGPGGMPNRGRACEQLNENMAERGDNGRAPDCSRQDDPEPDAPPPGRSTVLAATGEMGTAAAPLSRDPQIVVSGEGRHEYAFTLPDTVSDYLRLNVSVRWNLDGEYLDLQVVDPAGEVAAEGVFINTREQSVAVPEPVPGDYRVIVTERLTAGDLTQSVFTVIGTVDRPKEELTLCDAVHAGTAGGFGSPAVDNGITYGAPGELIFSFPNLAQRDRALAYLYSANLLDRGAELVHVYRHVPAFVAPFDLVTYPRVLALRDALARFHLVSIYANHALPLLLDTSVPFIDVDLARAHFGPQLPGGLTGQGVGISIIDSGIDESQGDFENVRENLKMVLFAGVAEVPNSDLTTGHGTHVAGTAGGTGARSDGRYQGVAPGADLFGYGAGDGVIFIALAIEAFDRSIDHKLTGRFNIRVTNNSYGGAGQFDPASPLMLAVKRAYDAGIYSVFAVGNGGSSGDVLSALAASPCAIGVANGTRAGTLSGTSSRGSADDPTRQPDVTAPGTIIVAPRAITGLASTPFPHPTNPFYAAISGTSMAAPHVAGLIALLLEANPDLSYEQVRAILRDTATPMFRPDGSAYQPFEVGAGYVDALAAVAAALNQPAPEDEIVLPGPGTTVVAQFSSKSGTTTPVVCTGCGDSESGFALHTFGYDLPPGDAYEELSVLLTWEGDAEAYALEVFDPSGASAGFSGFHLVAGRVGDNPAGANGHQVDVAGPPPGRYAIQVRENLALRSLFDVTVTVTCPDTGCALGDPEEPVDPVDPVDPPPDVAAARTVVAVIDSGINLYHQFYYEGSPIYPEGTPPSSVTQEVLDAFGIPPQNIIELTRSGDFAADFEADQAIWQNIERGGTLYWFRGTNVIAGTFAATGIPIFPDAETNTENHGTGTSAAVLKANPEAIVLFLEGINSAAERFAFGHPAVDFVSTSYGFLLGIPFPGHITDSFSGTYGRGKLHFGACDNTPSAAPHDSTCGPWWSIGIAGFEERDEDFDQGGDQPASHGRQFNSGTLPDFLGDFTQVLPFCRNCQDGYRRFTPGTSFATPRAAGTASRVLLEARRALGHLGGIFVDPAGPPEAAPLMAAGDLDGQAVTITNWQLRRALEEAAWIPDISEYDPIEGVFDFFGIPIPQQAPWTVAGWGVISPRFGDVVAETLARLGITGEATRSKSSEHCDFQTLVIEGRKLYWDFVDVDSETFMNPPQPDPFEFCEQGQLR